MNKFIYFCTAYSAIKILPIAALCIWYGISNKTLAVLCAVLAVLTLLGAVVTMWEGQDE